MAEIAALPLPRQQAALADAMRGHDRHERAEALRNASRAAEQERLDHYDDMRRDAEDDARAEEAESE
jgi:hypothetical protein